MANHQQQQQITQLIKKQHLVPCINKDCCFYGSPSTSNLCPFCFQENLILQIQAKLKKRISLCKKRRLAAEASNTQVQDQLNINGSGDKLITNHESDHNPAIKKLQGLRCHWCKKHLNICCVFKCRCGEQFCSSHRHSDEHNCSFDYKSAAEEAIAIANPVVKRDKLHYRI